MKNQSNQFLQKYKDSFFDIFLSNGDEPELLEGNINFYNYIEEDNEYIKNILAIVKIYTFNTYELKDLFYLADGISGDLLYVISAYCNYCDLYNGAGSITIIDQICIYEDIDNFVQEIKVIQWILLKSIKLLQILGTGTLLFMTKALVLDVEKCKRIKLIENLIDSNILPIYQDNIDVVMAINLNERIF